MLEVAGIVALFLTLWVGYTWGRNRERRRLGDGLWMGHTLVQVAAGLDRGQSRDVTVRRLEDGDTVMQFPGGGYLTISRTNRRKACSQ